MVVVSRVYSRFLGISHIQEYSFVRNTCQRDIIVNIYIHEGKSLVSASEQRFVGLLGGV